MNCERVRTIVKPNPLGFIHITESAAVRTRSQERKAILCFTCVSLMTSHMWDEKVICEEG